jgi:hypothetical protein
LRKIERQVFGATATRSVSEESFKAPPSGRSLTGQADQRSSPGDLPTVTIWKTGWAVSKKKAIRQRHYPASGQDWGVYTANRTSPLAPG